MEFPIMVQSETFCHNRCKRRAMREDVLGPASNIVGKRHIYNADKMTAFKKPNLAICPSGVASRPPKGVLNSFGFLWTNDPQNRVPESRRLGYPGGVLPKGRPQRRRTRGGSYPRAGSRLALTRTAPGTKGRMQGGRRGRGPPTTEP